MENVTWYLAGGGFTRRLQPLGQLTGAVAGCGAQGAETLLSMANGRRLTPGVHKANWTKDTSGRVDMELV